LNHNLFDFKSRKITVTTIFLKGQGTVKKRMKLFIWLSVCGAIIAWPLKRANLPARKTWHWMPLYFYISWF